MTDVSRFVDRQMNDSTRGWRADLNFLLTNRIPRHAATALMGWISGVRWGPFVKPALWLWRHCAPLHLEEAEHSHFDSIGACFTRRLKPDARPVQTNTQWACSPCDAIVGACGRVEDGLVLQAKGFPYHLRDLFVDAEQWQPYLNGHYVTLRLTASMYHHFHAPHDLILKHVTFIRGDTWNVNPVALRRVQKLFCKNERAVLHTELVSGYTMALVPVAAILVASLRLLALPQALNARHQGATEWPMDVSYRKGQEMGWFEHGSTIIVFTPTEVALRPQVRVGDQVKMGQALWEIAPLSSD